MDTDAEFFRELMGMFKMESQEQLQSICQGLKYLDDYPDGEERNERMETIFRAAHSLKGAARTVGVVDIETIGQTLEHFFSVVKQQETQISEQTRVHLDNILNHLGGLIESIDEAGKVTGDKSEAMRLMDELNDRIAELKS
ncbi:MAG TPA: hypothetical protein ENN03_03115 [bacterium]|nr:hypothetical protein [bacterium]